MKILLLIFSALLVLLLAGLWVGPGSYPQRWRTEERSAAQELSNTQRQDEINKMKSELEDASSGNAAIEERARSELGMTRKGETFYEVILQPDQEEASKTETDAKANPRGHSKTDSNLNTVKGRE